MLSKTNEQLHARFCNRLSESNHFSGSGSRKKQRLYPGIQRPIVFALMLFGLLPANTLFAQSSSPDQNWIYDKTVDGVHFSHSIADCSGKKVVFLKFENKNIYQVEVSWKEVFETQVDAATEGFSGSKTMTIPSGITMPAGCADAANKKNIILPSEVSPLYVAVIKKFDFKDIHVTKIN